MFYRITETNAHAAESGALIFLPSTTLREAGQNETGRNGDDYRYHSD